MDAHFVARVSQYAINPLRRSATFSAKANR